MLAVVKDPGDQPWSSKKVPSVGPGAGAHSGNNLTFHYFTVVGLSAKCEKYR